jgi:hypothetical protein
LPTPGSPDLRVHLYASILAQATNIGPVRMAELSDLSYRKLAWASTWYLREDTLKDAVAAMVNFHHALPLSASWGDGNLSSSDGQRFAVDVKARNARAIPAVSASDAASPTTLGPATSTPSTGPR